MRRHDTPSDMTPGTVHKSNCHGDVCVIKYRNTRSVTVVFMRCGRQRVVTANALRTGSLSPKRKRDGRSGRDVERQRQLVRKLEQELETYPDRVGHDAASFEAWRGGQT